MAKGNSVTVRIDGDSGGLKKELSNIKKTAAAGLADIKAGIDLTAAATRKLFDVASKGINYNATIEQLKTSFEVMTGSAEKAAEIVERLRVMGAETPFEMVDLASTTQLLMQYGFTADEAIDRMRMLGDIAQGNATAMNSIALGYAQMSSAGKVNLVDIKQMITAGFNPLQEISERTGESMASLYDRISKGTMTVDEITESMRHATSEGGKFFQSMEKQSQTLNGQLSTLKDNADQLLGSLTEGLSEDLRSELLPLASNLIGELQTAFDNGGYQGLVDSATGMLPDLLNMMTGELQKGITGLSRWLPQGATQLMKALPTALRGASAVVPEITTALFEVSSAIITDLVSMLPELGPTLAKGIVDTFVAAMKGLAFTVQDVLHEITDLATKDAEEIWDNLTDQDKTAELSAKVTGNVDVSGAKNAVNTATLELSGALDDLYAVLTNGAIEDDDPKTLQQRLDEAYNGDIETINTWLSGKISELDTDTTTYAANVAALKQEAENYKAELLLLHQQASALVASMAGQPTAVVEAKMSEFETLMTRIEELEDKLNEANDAAQSLYFKSFERVKAGASTDTSDIANALSYAYSNFKVNQQAIEDAAAAAKAEADAAWDAGLKTEEDNAAHLDTLKEIEEKRTAEMQQLETTYASQLSELLKGLGEAFAVTEPETMQQISAIAEKLNIVQILNDQLATIQTGDDAAVQATKQAIAGIMSDLTGEEVFPSEINYGRAESFVTELENSIKTDLAEISLLGEDGTNPVLTAFQGMFDSVAFTDLEIDTSTLETKISTIMNGVGSNAGAGLGSGAAGYDFSGDTDTMASNFESDTKTSFDMNSPSRKMKPLGSNVAAGVGEGAAEFDFSGYASTMASNMESAIGNSLLNAGMKAGKSFSSGLSTGIYAGKSGVIQAAINVAKAAIDAANQTLEINSPSKATMRSGNSFGEGFAIGIRQSMENAVLVARRMTGEIATAAQISMPMQVRVPDMQQSIEYALEATQQPVNLYVNGRELARVTASDTQQAQNWHNRRIALGVGK